MTSSEKILFLIKHLISEQPELSGTPIPRGIDDRKKLLRALMNIRPPMEADSEFLSVQDEFLREEIAKKGITDAADLPEPRPGISVWQGDITTLRCDAIVNAANSGMTGCYVPNHRCIDNAIHTFAGVELRLACAKLMDGREEPTGKAELTPAFNLPCRYVLHTVGPIIYDSVKQSDERLLASCYSSCLEKADKNNLQSVAFCCISTGEFHFPNERAAEIAINTVTEYMTKSVNIKKVIFNVFKDRDREIYERLLG